MYPRFLTLFIEWLRFLVLITWPVKTENFDDLLIYFFLIIEHFSFCVAVPNLHVSPKTEIYLDFSIKDAAFVFVAEICDFSVFVYTFYSFN